MLLTHATLLSVFLVYLLSIPHILHNSLLHISRTPHILSSYPLYTGDLSELALGWCTYGVGDHMSHYNVNCSVSKTLIRYVIEWVADRNEVGPEASPVLRKILATEIRSVSLFS